MADSASIPARQPDPHAAALAEIEDVYPNWTAWTGVNGWLYARRLRTSPPCVLHAGTTARLWVRVAAEESRRAR
jgi:hypothetical protein